MRFSHIVLIGILGLALVADAVADPPITGRTLADLGDRNREIKRGGETRDIGGTTVGRGYLVGPLNRNGGVGGFASRDGEAVGGAKYKAGEWRGSMLGYNTDDGWGLYSSRVRGRRLAGLDLERGAGSRQIGDATVGGGYLIGDRNGAIGGVVERNGEYRGVAGFDVGDNTFGVRGSLGEDGLHLKKIGGNNGRRLADLGDRGEDRQTWRGSRTIGDATVSGGLLRNDDDFGIGGVRVDTEGGFRRMGGVSTDEGRRIRRSGGWISPSA